MKTKFKRIASLALGLVLALVLAAPALAADVKVEDDGTSVTASTTASFTIPKEIVLFNTDGSTIYEPNVSYSYTLTAVTITEGSTYITDKNGVRGTVKTGVLTGNAVTIVGTSGTAGTTATVEFGGTSDSNTHETNTEGTAVGETSKVATKNITVAIDAIKFSSPGVYRYKISDTTTDTTISDAGVYRNSTDYKPDRYLDVYIKWNDDKSALQVYGYVLFKLTDGATTLTETSSIAYDSGVTTAVKVTGYDVKSEQETSGGDTKYFSDQ